jgi:hypothetical protein
MSFDLPHNALIVLADGSVAGYSQSAQNWGDLGFAGNWSLKMLTFDDVGRMYVVGTDGNLKSLDSFTMIHGVWNDLAWTLDWVALQPKTGLLWMVGTDGNVGTWTASGVQNFGNWGGWTLKSLTFDADGALWGVGTEGNLGNWDFAGEQWVDKTAVYGGWTLNMVAFDADGKMWCVGTEGNIGQMGDNGWVDQGTVLGQQVKAIAFQFHPYPA